jgi:hypothetical protein
VSLGGNKEYYEAALAITRHNRRQLFELQKKGLDLYKTNQSSLARNNERKTEAIFNKMLEISTILNPQGYDPGSFKVTIKETLSDLMTDKNVTEKMSQLYRLELIEKMLAHDITGLYYLNLHSEYEYELGSAKYLSNKDEESMKTDSKKIHQQQILLLPLSSDDMLLAILEEDKEIRDWFLKWLEDIRNYQKETLEEINNFHKKINSKNNL